MTQLPPIAVLLVDDHAVVREGYRRLLQAEPGLQVVGEAGTAAQGLWLWRRLRPQVMVVDLALPGMGGVELIARVRQRDPSSRCLAFSMHRDPLWVLQALRAGAAGYVTKSSDPALLVQAVREAAAGRQLVSPDIALPVVQQLQADSAGDDLAARLSPREFEVLRLLTAGLSATDIGEQLHLSPKTVHNLHYRIKFKLGAGSDFTLARWALQQGLGGG